MVCTGVVQYLTLLKCIISYLIILFNSLFNKVYKNKNSNKSKIKNKINARPLKPRNIFELLLLNQVNYKLKISQSSRSMIQVYSFLVLMQLAK